MTLRVCPKCEKAFYIFTEEKLPTCPHCGFRAFKRTEIHGQRAHERLETNIDFNFSFGGVVKTAKVTDYSESGARIVYKGPQLPVDSTLDLNIEELSIKSTAKAIWTKKLSITMNSTGLRFKNR
jgi:DNA-directed RNA polymerase subunit RPC12/RpoP